jgi:ribosomal protein S18 acetylase RimI-like enzyme
MMEFVKPDGRHLEAVTAFFAVLDTPEIRTNFHPHDFTPVRARALCCYAGRDEYYIALQGGRVAAYGMLRGWDEGYDVPSLGICVAPDCHGQGVGSAMMECLVAAARLRGAPRIILKVRKVNTAAVALYSRFGFQLTELDQDCWRGSLVL